MQSDLRYYLRFLAIGILALLPALAQAGGAFLMKGGSMRLVDNTQTFDFGSRILDDTSNRTLAINVEGRARNGMAFGAEYLTYSHDFTSTPAQAGDAKTQTMQFLAKKYFIDGGPVHPYVGVGIGVGRTNINYAGTGSFFSDNNFAFALQALIGLELRFDNLSFLAEVKHMYHDVSSSGNEYDPTATGLFIGAGFNW